jgi:hypothetical protein
MLRGIKAKIQIMKIKKKLTAIKLMSAEYKQLHLPGNNFWFLQIKNYLHI